MLKKKNAVVLLVPGFPVDEQDTTCIPFLQQFCLAFIKTRPEIELRVISFQYPFKRGNYTWHGINVYSASGRSKKINRGLTWIRVYNEFGKIKRECNVTIVNSFWMTECAFVGQWLTQLHHVRHIVYLIGQDALKTNRYLPFINFRKMEIIGSSKILVKRFYETTGYWVYHIIPSGIDMDKIKPNPAERPIDIVGVGALTPLKGYLLFPELINELKKDFPEIKACLIGKGEQNDAIQAKIKEYNLENNLELLGEVQHKDVFTYMQKSKILLHTSSYEGQSTVITEALACGLMVVCFDIGRTEVKDRISVCKDTGEMLLKLRELLSSQHTYEPVISFTNEEMVKEFFKVYENTLSDMGTGFSSDSFYNSVAAEYNDRMNSDAQNGKTRKIVAEYFASTVKGKNVLDFGGGTGSDLEWLTTHGFNVWFCEPSIGMRDVAMKSHAQRSEIHFSDNANTDFRQWNATTFPQKFDGILANFAAINSIDNIQFLFQKLNEIIAPGGHIIATLLDTTNYGIIKHYVKNFLSAYAKNDSPVLITQHAGIRHSAYLHTSEKLRKALKPNFSSIKIEAIPGSGFMLLHCQKSISDGK